MESREVTPVKYLKGGFKKFNNKMRRNKRSKTIGPNETTLDNIRLVSVISLRRSVFSLMAVSFYTLCLVE